MNQAIKSLICVKKTSGTSSSSGDSLLIFPVPGQFRGQFTYLWINWVVACLA